ncbi:MAG: DUF3786 domain-containing protein [Candidatus Omnitrophica bacterium]|nr:DUF3786 domain-containing protein [Candidatus Omnitrophota bacterium]
MGYEAALNKAWDDLLYLNPNPAKNLLVKFMADEYSVDIRERKVFSSSCNIPAKDFTSILLLHYLAKQPKGLPAPSGQWLTFREFSGVEGYYEAFHRRCIEPIIRKYGRNPDALKDIPARLPAMLSDGADVSLVIEAFADVPVLVKLWKQDAEFGPEANMYFDSGIKDIFCTEDIVVLAQMIASQL